jgi:hypothetical protein
MFRCYIMLLEQASHLSAKAEDQGTRSVSVGKLAIPPLLHNVDGNPRAVRSTIGSYEFVLC